MSITNLRRSAARSAARQKKTETAPPPPTAPGWEVKKSPRGTLYRVTTVSLADFPRFMAENDFDPKTYFYYGPEADPKKSPDPGFVLGVRRRGEKETREL